MEKIKLNRWRSPLQTGGETQNHAFVIIGQMESRASTVLDLDHTDEFKPIIVDAGFLATERERRNFNDLFVGWQTRGSRDLSLPREGIELIVDEEKRAERISNSFKVDDVLRLARCGRRRRKWGAARLLRAAAWRRRSAEGPIGA